MSWLSSFLHPGRAYDAAADEVRKSQEQAMGYQDPYNQAGLGVLPDLQNALAALMNPEKLQNEWASGYETSPYAQDQLRRNQMSGMDAASQMGLTGSSAALENIQTGAGEIMNKDRQQYLDNIMQKYLTGITGLQGLYGTGANTAGNMANQSLQTGNILGGLSAGKQQAGGGMFGTGLGLLASLMGGGGLQLPNFIFGDTIV